MRIWILTSELPHGFAAGIGRYVGNFARLAGANGHEVIVIGRSQKEIDEIVSLGVRYVGFVSRYELLNEKHKGEPDGHPAYPYNVIGFGPAQSFQIADKVAELLAESPPPDVIECQDFAGLAYYLLHRKLVEHGPLESIPIVVHMHGPLHELTPVNHGPRYRFPDYWIGQLEKACILMADAVLGPSNFLADRIRRVLQQPLPIERIFYPVDYENSREPVDGAPREVVYVGRLQVLKGVLPMLQACARLWEQGRDFRLRLIGADTTFEARNISMREYIEKRYARWIESGKLVIAGVLPYEELLEHVHKAWVSIVPSLWENFPLVCIEAMMVGQLVLASRSGGQAEMIEEDGKYGFLFDWDVPGDFERQLSRVLDLAPEERMAVARRAHERIHTICDPQSVLEQRIAHFERVIREHKPRRSYPALHWPRRDRSLPPTVTPTPLPNNYEEQAGLLSVVIPYYNLGEFVEESIASLDASTYRPLEIVIIDDGSTDARSLQVLDKLEAQGRPDLRIVHCQNAGLATSRNRGAEHARGEFVFFLDADDLVEPDFFERAIDVLQRYDNVDFVYPWVRYFGASVGFWPTWNAEFPYLLGHNMASGGFTVVRRQAFLKFGRNKPIVEYSLEDFEMWVSMAEAGCIGVSLPRPLVRYRVRGDSMWQTSNAQQQLYLHDVISELHPEAYREWGLELFNLQNANGPSRLWNHPAMDGATIANALAVGASQESQLDHIELQRQRIQELDSHVIEQWERIQRLYARGVNLRSRLLYRVLRKSRLLPDIDGF